MTVQGTGEIQENPFTDEESQMNSGSVNPSLSSQIYTREYYLEVCGGYKEFEDDGIAQRLLKAIEYAKIEPGMRILDIGCGRGELARWCSEQGCEVWAVDYSSEALNLAKRHVRQPKIPSLSELPYLHQMNSKSLALSDDTFDRVFMIDIVEHLYPRELEMALSEAKRVLRPGGRLVVHTAPNAWLIEPIYFLAGSLFGWQRHPYHVNEQSYFSLRDVLAQVGESVQVEIEKVPGFFKLGLGSEGNQRRNLDTLAGILDGVGDSRPVTWLIQSTPLSHFFGTDLWAIVEGIPQGKGI